MLVECSNMTRQYLICKIQILSIFTSNIPLRDFRFYKKINSIHHEVISFGHFQNTLCLPGGPMFYLHSTEDISQGLS